MDILVVTKYGQEKLVESDVIPQIGAKVDMFYSPAPLVVEVLMWPTKDTLNAFKVSTAVGIDIKAIVFVE